MSFHSECIQFCNHTPTCIMLLCKGKWHQRWSTTCTLEGNPTDKLSIAMYGQRTHGSMTQCSSATASMLQVVQPNRSLPLTVNNLFGTDISVIDAATLYCISLLTCMYTTYDSDTSLSCWNGLAGFLLDMFSSCLPGMSIEHVSVLGHLDLC